MSKTIANILLLGKSGPESVENSRKNNVEREPRDRDPAATTAILENLDGDSEVAKRVPALYDKMNGNKLAVLKMVPFAPVSFEKRSLAW